MELNAIYSYLNNPHSQFTVQYEKYIRYWFYYLILGKDTAKNDERTSGLNARSFLDHPILLSVIPVNERISGIAVLGDEMFAVHGRSPCVYVYNTTDFTFIRNMTITGSQSLRAVLANPENNCLYISDYDQRFIYRYNLSNNVITRWSVGGRCYGLSLTKDNSAIRDNLLVTLFDTKQIKEYTPEGRLVREISFESGIVEPWHSIKLSSNMFVVSHGFYDPIQQVSEVNTSGSIVKSYGNSRGSNGGQLNTPGHLAVDGYGNVLVADSLNNRVVLLSPSLKNLGEITIPGYEFSMPWSLHLDESNNRLYIGEEITSAGRVFVLAI